jgi:nitrogenase-associated protein
MAMVIFYEKPGCANNTRQKQLLVNAGHQVIAKNLLKNNFKAKTLRAFLANKTIPEWFNRAAPAIKSGQIVPEELDEMTALALLLTYPLLIRRPLIQVGDICEAGLTRHGLMNGSALPQNKSVHWHNKT